jgi:hypothetical protein
MRHLPAFPAVSRLRSLARLLAAPLVVGARPGRPNLIKEVEGKLRVFNVQLRAVEDPNIIDDPNLRPHGHLQLKVTRLADGSVRVAWKGQVTNPGGLAFTSWSLFHNNDLHHGRPLLLVAFGEVEGITDRQIDFEGVTNASAELAARLYGTPDTIDDPNIRVVFFTTRRPGGALEGTF